MKKHQILFTTENSQSIIADIKTQTRRAGNKCKYNIGDHLFVKETHYKYGEWHQDGLTKKGKTKWRFKALKDDVRFPDNMPKFVMKDSYRKPGWYQRNSFFMFERDSRVTLEVTGIRFEKLQDISGTDAIAEGVKSKIVRMGPIAVTSFYDYVNEVYRFGSPRDSFMSLWESINGDKYDLDSTITVIEFKRLTNEHNEQEVQGDGQEKQARGGMLDMF